MLHISSWSGIYRSKGAPVGWGEQTLTHVVTEPRTWTRQTEPTTSGPDKENNNTLLHQHDHIYSKKRPEITTFYAHQQNHAAFGETYREGRKVAPNSWTMTRQLTNQVRSVPPSKTASALGQTVFFFFFLTLHSPPCNAPFQKSDVPQERGLGILREFLFPTGPSFSSGACCSSPTTRRLTVRIRIGGGYATAL